MYAERGFGVEAKQILRGTEESVIKRMKKTYGIHRVLPVDSAVKLINAGKLIIGWVVCRLRKQVFLICLDFGHFALCISEDVGLNEVYTNQPQLLRGSSTFSLRNRGPNVDVALLNEPITVMLRG